MQPSEEFSTNVPDLTSAFMTTDSLVLTAFKIAFLFVAVMYVVYGVVIVRQVKIMNNTVATQLGPVIQLAAWVHLAIAIGFGLGVLLLL